MKDFYNNEIDAVWICKVCNRWLSKESLIELDNWIVCNIWNCKKEYEKQEEIISFSHKNLSNFKKSKSWKLSRTLFPFLFGILFLITWISNSINRWDLDYLAIWIGSLFIITWIITYFNQKEILKNSENEKLTK